MISIPVHRSIVILDCDATMEGLMRQASRGMFNLNKIQKDRHFPASYAPGNPGPLLEQESGQRFGQPEFIFIGRQATVCRQ